MTGHVIRRWRVELLAARTTGLDGLVVPCLRRNARFVRGARAHRSGPRPLPPRLHSGDNPALVLSSSAVCVQACRTHAPALLLTLFRSPASPSMDFCDVQDAWGRYAAKSEGTSGNGPPAAQRQSNHRARNRSPAAALTAGDESAAAALLGTEFGAAWTLQSAGAGAAAVVEALRAGCQVDAYPPDCIVQLVRALLLCVEGGSFSERQLSSQVEGCLELATPLHVASLVAGLQLQQQRTPHAETEEECSCCGLVRWHRAVPVNLARRCLQQVADATRQQRGRHDALPGNVLQSLHAVAMCMLPPGLTATDTLRVELALLSMSALKHAPFVQLQQLFLYLEQEHVATPAVSNKFLASCGMLLGAADAQGRVGVPVGDGPGGADLVARAVRSLADSGRELRMIEEGLVHGCSVLAALGRGEEVRRVYGRFPSLRVTPHHVMMYVAERDVTGAVRALDALARSRPEGWVRLPPVVQQVVTQTCELVGRAGQAGDVAPLYRAVVAFHNAGMITSQQIEAVLAGICARMRHLDEDCVQQAASSLEEVAPRVVLEHVVPVTRAALSFVGDDLNADLVLALLETALETNSMAVPLTGALMWSLRQSPSLSIRELFLRVDNSTNNLPFLYYYALCFARDRGLDDTAEHLAAVWHVDCGPILQRQAHLAPPYKLWRCAGCGRLNSDRYNYCVCSALRNGFVVCATCGYGQDERWPSCLSCGAAVGTGGAGVAAAIPRVAWSCSACRASNPARQVLLCFRCAAPTGPLFSQASTAAEDVAGQCACSSGGTRGASSSAAYSSKVRCCHDCGHVVGARPTGGSASTAAALRTWRCAGCDQLRSALERSCPACPQVECLPAAVAHPVSARRYCWQCGRVQHNAFAAECGQCGGSDLRLSPPAASCQQESERAAAPATPPSPATSTGAAPAAGESPTTGMLETVLWCSQCGSTQAATAAAAVGEENRSAGLPTTSSCTHCGHDLTDEACSILSGPRECHSCRHTIPSTTLSAVCPHCSSFVGILDSAQWHPAHVVATAVAVVHHLSPEEAGGGAAPISPATAVPTPEEVDKRHDRLLKLRAALTRWLCAWVAAAAAADATSATSTTDLGDDEAQRLPRATLHSSRLDLFMELNILLRHLRVLFASEPVARRCGALVKQLMAHVDERCGLADHVHWCEEEQCHECLGGHPAALCEYQSISTVLDTAAQAADGSLVHDTLGGTEGPSPPSWTCGECGVTSRNEDVCRYLCTGCLSLRPEVQDLFPAECWECGQCQRANVEFESYCIHCGFARPSVPVSSVVRDEGDGAVAKHIPFLPCRCALCGLVYLEASCPLCENHLPDVAEAKGVVCAVGKKHAYIQPVGTSRIQDRIFVDEQVVRGGGAVLTQGRVVHYLAELRRGSHGVGFHATHVRQ